MRKRAIYWFRNNQRLYDNPSLHRAVQENEQLIFVYVLHDRLFGKHPLGFDRCGKWRWKFLLESLAALKKDLESRGATLLLLKGDPVEALVKVADSYSVQDIYCSREVEHDEIKEEELLAATYRLHMEYDQLLFPPDQLPFEISSLPFVFTQFRKSVEKNIPVREELPASDILLSPETCAYDQYETDPLDAHPDPKSAFPFEGGESEAWERIQHYFWQTDLLQNYKYTRNQLIGPEYSSKLSAFLALGNISPVSILNQIRKYERERKKNISTYWLYFELLWREFFKLVSLKYGASIFRKEGILKKEIEYQNDKTNFQKWIKGETGNDFVDANMIELRETGYISNRGRQNVASYLAHDLLIDWRWGAAYLESQLIDYDCASNWCNWMYVAGVGNDPRQRKFDTQWQAQKYDPKANYRKKWIA